MLDFEETIHKFLKEKSQKKPLTQWKTTKEQWVIFLEPNLTGLDHALATDCRSNKI